MDRLVVVAPVDLRQDFWKLKIREKQTENAPVP